MMTFFHKSKQAAIDYGQKYADHFEVTAEFTDLNGWNLRLYPLSIEVFRFPLYSVLEEAFIDFVRMPSARILPDNYVVRQKLDKVVVPRGRATRPVAAPSAPPPPPPARAAPTAPTAAPPPPPPPPR